MSCSRLRTMPPSAKLSAFLSSRLHWPELSSRPRPRQFVANLGWLFAEKGLRVAIGLLVGAWVARYLKPSGFGLLSYATAFVMLFSALAGMGLESIVVRELVRNPTARDEILGTSWLLRLVGSSAAFLLTIIAIVLLRPGDGAMHALVGIIAAGVFLQSLEVIDCWFQSQVRSKHVAIARSSALVLISAVRVGLVLGQAPLVAFAWCALGEVAAASVGLAVAYGLRGGRLRAWRVSAERAKALLRDSWPLVFSGVVIMIYMRIDQLMLGAMVGPEEVGIYASAVRLAELWYFVPMAVYSSALPSIVEARAISEELFFSRLQRLYNAMALIGYAVALPVTVLAPWIVDYLFGSAYHRAAPMLAVLIWAGLFTSLGVARAAFLTAMNWTKLHFMTLLLGAIVNVFLNMLLIPSHGGMGAVIASCVAYWLVAHGACFVFKPLRRTGVMLTKALIFPKPW